MRKKIKIQNVTIRKTFTFTCKFCEHTETVHATVKFCPNCGKDVNTLTDKEIIYQKLEAIFIELIEKKEAVERVTNKICFYKCGYIEFRGKFVYEGKMSNRPFNFYVDHYTEFKEILIKTRQVHEETKEKRRLATESILVDDF